MARSLIAAWNWLSFLAVADLVFVFLALSLLALAQRRESERLPRRVPCVGLPTLAINAGSKSPDYQVARSGMFPGPCLPFASTLRIVVGSCLLL